MGIAICVLVCASIVALLVSLAYEEEYFDTDPAFTSLEDFRRIRKPSVRDVNYVAYKNARRHYLRRVDAIGDVKGISDAVRAAAREEMRQYQLQQNLVDRRNRDHIVQDLYPIQEHQVFDARLLQNASQNARECAQFPICRPGARRLPSRADRFVRITKRW